MSMSCQVPGKYKIVSRIAFLVSYGLLQLVIVWLSPLPGTIVLLGRYLYALLGKNRYILPKARAAAAIYRILFLSYPTDTEELIIQIKEGNG